MKFTYIIGSAISITIGICFIIFGIFLFLYPVIVPLDRCPYFTLDPVDIQTRWANNDYIKERYTTDIFQKGKIIVEEEIYKVQALSDSNSKLDEIFLWEMANWHEPNLEINKFNSSNGNTYKVLKDNGSRIYPINWFQYTTAGQFSPNGTFYGNDPYWIAYNMVGACNELSNLFAYMANESGIPSRTVQTVNHQWVEVNISGKWMYYDPWCALEKGYYNNTDKNLSLKYKWYNERRYFRENCLCHAYLIWDNEFSFVGPTFDYL